MYKSRENIDSQQRAMQKNTVKINSLSVGNYLKKDGVVVKIDARSIFDIWNEKGIIKHGYEPILLTEEWLLKLGFNKEYHHDYIGIDVGDTDFVLTYPNVIGEFWEHFIFQFEAGGVSKLKEIKYVHELQNLFHSLTGTELTRK